MEVSKEFMDTIEYVRSMLLYRVKATPVEGETVFIPAEGEDGPFLWKANTTTYTLGLMLGGALSIEEERRNALYEQYGGIMPPEVQEEVEKHLKEM